MNQYAAELKCGTKKYGQFTALDKVSLKIEKGKIYGLIGDNGAGKSTFLKLLTGQIFLTEGELVLFGEHEKQRLNQVRSRTGAMIESPGFYPQLTVEKNLEYYRIQKGIPGKQTVTKTLELIGLTEAKNKRCRDLSMGMKQRLGLGIALLGEPEFLILDEPVNGLDPSGIIEMRQLLLKLNREKHITIILSSHLLSELEQVADVYGFLHKGRLLEQITAHKLNEQCSDYIEITVSDTESYTAILEKQFGHTAFKVLPDKTVCIYRPEREDKAYSGLAFEHNIGVIKFGRNYASLEDYYVNLKKGGN